MKHGDFPISYVNVYRRVFASHAVWSWKNPFPAGSNLIAHQRGGKTVAWSWAEEIWAEVFHLALENKKWWNWSSCRSIKTHWCALQVHQMYFPMYVVKVERQGHGDLTKNLGKFHHDRTLFSLTITIVTKDLRGVIPIAGRKIQVSEIL